jgi:hypothetical protein
MYDRCAPSGFAVPACCRNCTDRCSLQRCQEGCCLSLQSQECRRVRRLRRHPCTCQKQRPRKVPWPWSDSGVWLATHACTGTEALLLVHRRHPYPEGFQYQRHNVLPPDVHLVQLANGCACCRCALASAGLSMSYWMSRPTWTTCRPGGETCTVTGCPCNQAGDGMQYDGDGGLISLQVRILTPFLGPPLLVHQGSTMA